eukprot:scpid100567/ scgid33179/ 
MAAFSPSIDIQQVLLMLLFQILLLLLNLSGTTASEIENSSNATLAWKQSVNCTETCQPCDNATSDLLWLSVNPTCTPCTYDYGNATEADHILSMWMVACKGPGQCCLSATTLTGANIYHNWSMLIATTNATLDLRLEVSSTCQDTNEYVPCIRWNEAHQPTHPPAMKTTSTDTNAAGLMAGEAHPLPVGSVANATTASVANPTSVSITNSTNVSVPNSTNVS